MVIPGKKLRTSKVKQDVFVLAAVEDHIAPWRSSFKTTQLWGGKVKFVLSSAGHIAGIVNPPSKNAVHWTNDKPASDPDEWQAAATKHAEPRREEWARWLGQRAGGRATPPPICSKSQPSRSQGPATR